MDRFPPLDYYNDEDVELEFLLSKPAAFLIIGKPFSGKTTLGKKLAKEWNCPLINPDELIDEAIKCQSDIGQVCQEFLERGLKVEQDLLFALIKERMELFELLNTGYVLDGFPILADRGMNVPDQLSLMDAWNLKPNVLIHIKTTDGDIIKRKQSCKIIPLTGVVHVQQELDENISNERSDQSTENDVEFEPESKEEINLPHFEKEEFDKVNHFVSENMVSVSTQIMRQFIRDLDRFNRKFPLLQNYIASRPKIITIELNGNLPPKSLFKGLTNTLKMMPVSPTIHPILLSETSDFSIQDDASLDNMIYFLNKVNMVAPLFRWKLSKWGQFCPVDLKNGKLILGKLANSVVFRDKIYFIAKEENLKLFLQNPRPYLIPPMPLHPCKFIIFGHIKTGKTNLAWKLAAKFKGRVIDFDKLMQIYTREMREQCLDEIWHETLNDTIAEIQTREVINAAFLSETKRAIRLHELVMEAAGRFHDEKEKPPKSRQRKSSIYGMSKTSQSTAKSDFESADSKSTQGSSEGSMATFEERYMHYMDSESLLQQIDDEETELEIPLVDEDHPEVVAIINNVMEAAESEESPIENAHYVQQLKNEIEYQRLILSQYGALDLRDGGWVIDNFPADQRLFETAIKMGVVPVCVVILKDPTEDYKIVSRRYVKTKFRKRTIITEGSHPSPAFEIQEQSEETSSESAPDFDRLMEEELQKTIIEEEEESESHASTIKVEEEQIEAKPQMTESEIALIKLKGTLSQMDTFFDSLPNFLPSDGTITIIPIQITNLKSYTYTGDSYGTTPEEYATVNMSRFNSSQQFHAMSDVQSQATRSELIAVHDIAATVPRIHKTPDDVAMEVVSTLEAEFHYKGKIVGDLDKEQHEADVLQNVDVVVDIRDGEDAFMNLLQLGDSDVCCPVALKENQVLYPGKGDFELKYKEKTYWFSSENAMESFVRRPLDYVADKKPLTLPPLRICLVGPFGSQRTEQARLLASSLNIYHINFRERLQELLVSKLERKLGFPYQIDQEQIDEEEELMKNESKLESIRTSLDLDSRDSQLSVTWSELENSEEKTKKMKRSNADESFEESHEIFEDASFSMDVLTEEERNYKDYLQNGTPIHESSLEQLVSAWWYQEPYSSTGFVLDGFPNNVEETEFLLNHGLLPDTVIFFIVSDIDVIQKLRSGCMEIWAERKSAKKMKKEQEKRIEKELRDQEIAKRRVMLEEEIEKRKAEYENLENQDESEDEEPEDHETEINIDEILAEEFPEIEEEVEEDEETPEMAEAKYTTYLLGMLQQYEEMSNLIKEMFQEARIYCSTVDSRKDAVKGSRDLRNAITRFVERRDNLLEKVYPITLNLAEKLIHSGYKSKSNFGFWCPVKLYEGEIIPNVSFKEDEPYPVFHRHHIYYLSSKSAREKFLLEPMKYICQPMPPPIVPLNLAIVGTPFSGKSTLINRFVNEYHLIRLTTKQILSYVIERLSYSKLSDFIKECLEKGEVVSNELVAAAVDEVMTHPVCQQQGVLLDEIPNSLELAEYLTERNIIPFCIFELNLPYNETLKRLNRHELQLDKSILKQSRELFKHQYEMSFFELSQLKEYYEPAHHNWISLDAHRSQWWLWTNASAKFLECAKSIQNYIVSIQKGDAAELENMNLTPEEFRAGLGIFRFFCPVSLAIDGELIDCSNIKDNKFTAEYNGKYYTMCNDEHLKMFLSNPEVFLPPRAIRLPPKVNEEPELVSLEKCLRFSKSQIEFGGFCPVTYLQGLKTYESLTKGNPKFGASYNSKVYFMASEENRKTFMRKPDHFVHLKLPAKVPGDLQLMNILGLPIIGYLEQTVVEDLLNTLMAVATKKPKYPFLDISRSAALFIAYHLKAHNPKNSAYTRNKYLEKLNEYEQNCELLQFVIRNMTLMPSKTSSRPVDFDIKLKSLFNLKPRPEWLNETPKIPKAGVNYHTL